MTDLSKMQRVLIGGLVAALAVGGYFQFSQFADYTFASNRHLDDIFRAKIWTLACIGIALIVIYWKRNSPLASYLTVFCLSAYFVILYGILFRGTEFGLHGLWGDNFYRLSMVNKMMYTGGLSDAHQKNLPSLYPPLWFYTMAIYAKALGIQAYQTIKFGYFALFLIYPWIIFFLWRKIVSPQVAAAIAVGILFFSHRFIGYLFYEHVSAGLFFPWWLYYFEGATVRSDRDAFDWKHYVSGSIIGGLIFMTYYWWFFLAIAAFPISLAFRYSDSRSFVRIWRDFRRMVLVGGGVAVVASPYWLPLVIAAIGTGRESTQATWFHMGHTNLTAHWGVFSLEGTLIALGIFFAFYHWKYWKNAHLALLFCGGFLLLMVDRMVNLASFSIQTRKLLEFVHVFALPPLALGIVELWRRCRGKDDLKRGLLGAAALLFIIFANQHTQLMGDKRYRMGVGQRVPETHLDLLRTVDCDGKVFLTNWYVEACFIPYYVFIPTSKVHTHLAGQFDKRKTFLKNTGRITEPDLLAYALTYNKYDRINFILLPFNQNTKSYELQLTSVPFNKPTVFDTVRILSAAFEDTVHIRRNHPRGPFEIRPPTRSIEEDRRLQNLYPAVYRELTPFSESQS